MKIRSITCFYNPIFPYKFDVLKHLSSFSVSAIDQFTDVGFEVQTTRLATPSFTKMFSTQSNNNILHQIQEIESAALDSGFSYISLGPATPETPNSYHLIPGFLAETKNVFLTGIMGDQKNGINLNAVRACADVIIENAKISPDGFTNLRFAALANVLPGAPFFPAAYHQGDELRFSLAIECADAAIQAFSNSLSISQATEKLLFLLESAAKNLTIQARKLSADFNLVFGGIDFSLAPFPNLDCSLGGAIELLGPSQIGKMGSLAAAAIVADTLDRGNWVRAGFNGLMLPVLEDSILALRSLEGSLSIRDLLLFSAVCGTGLDTVPLPGNITPDEIAPLLMDIAALAVRLDKPLTARLMPVPGKKAGDKTEFDFGFFENGGILSVHSQKLTGLLSNDGIIHLSSRSSNRTNVPE